MGINDRQEHIKEKKGGTSGYAAMLCGKQLQVVREDCVGVMMIRIIVLRRRN